ncbi:hypothetical protein GCM10023317_86400 [Actinopolymorpha pittospori]
MVIAEPTRAFQSVGFTPARTTRTRTWPGPGSGTGRSASRMTLDGPFSVYTIARMPSMLGNGIRRRRETCTEPLYE